MSGEYTQRCIIYIPTLHNIPIIQINRKTTKDRDYNVDCFDMIANGNRKTHYNLIIFPFLCHQHSTFSRFDCSLPFGFHCRCNVQIGIQIMHKFYTHRMKLDYNVPLWHRIDALCSLCHILVHRFNVLPQYDSYEGKY